MSRDKREPLFFASDTILSHNFFTASDLSCAISSNFFGKKSEAPASSASNVAVAPSWVSEENISIGTCLSLARI